MIDMDTIEEAEERKRQAENLKAAADMFEDAEEEAEGKAEEKAKAKN